MPKYKYVDGVKYRVVPQSVLGYALVREGSDNSLPAGGTEGQVLTKASDADYDVEWTTVESGGVGYSFIAVNNSGTITAEIDVDALISACENHEYVRAILVDSSEDESYTVLPLSIYYSLEDVSEMMFSVSSVDIGVGNVAVGYQTLTVNITNGIATVLYETDNAFITTS